MLGAVLCAAFHVVYRTVVYLLQTRVQWTRDITNWLVDHMDPPVQRKVTGILSQVSKTVLKNWFVPSPAIQTKNRDTIAVAYTLLVIGVCLLLLIAMLVTAMQGTAALIEHVFSIAAMYAVIGITGLLLFPRVPLPWDGISEAEHGAILRAAYRVARDTT